MKTQIFRLEPHDDANSVRDKLSWAKATRILLAFPRHRPPRFSRLDLVLIQRATNQVGGQLGLVARDETILQIASDLGIPVFASIPAAQRLPWRTKSKPHRPSVFRDRMKLPAAETFKKFQRPFSRTLPIWSRILFFTIGIAAFLSIVLLFIPSAEVGISLPQETQSIDLSVHPEVGGNFELQTGILPAVILSTTVEGQMEIEVTGIGSIPVNSASTILTITNLSVQPVTIPANTVFTAQVDPPQRFISKIPVNIEGGYGDVRQVTVYAEKSGSAGNVPANSITTVNGDLGFMIKVTNPYAAIGGSDRSGRFASETDYTQVNDALVTSLVEDAITELNAAYSDNLVLLPETFKVDGIVDEKRLPEVNSPADRVKLTLKIKVSGLAVSRADLIALASFVLDAQQSEGKIIYPESYSVDSLSPPNTDKDGLMSWKVRVSRSLISNLDVENLLAGIMGKRADSASQVLQSKLSLVEEPDIWISPAWWQRLPYIPSRIKVSLQ